MATTGTTKRTPRLKRIRAERTPVQMPTATHRRLADAAHRARAKSLHEMTDFALLAWDRVGPEVRGEIIELIIAAKRGAK